MSTVGKEVEAALLNSEGDPKEEVALALAAVVRFAVSECEMTRGDLTLMLCGAIALAEK